MTRTLLIIFSIHLIFYSFAQEQKYLSPTDFEIDKSNNQLYVVGKTARELRSYNLTDFSLNRMLTTDLPPKAIKIAGNNLLVSQSWSEGELLVIDKNNFEIKSKIKVGNGACDITTTSDFKTAFVANQFSNDISVVDLTSNRETIRIPVLRQPMQVEISEDEKFLFVANFITARRADLDTVTSEVTIIDLETQSVIKNIQLANGSNALRGMSLSVDGKYVFISHNLGRFQVPTSQLEQGWMNTSALSIIDAHTHEFVATVLLDQPEYGAAGSWGIDCTEEFIFVAHSGTHDFSKIDYPKFVVKLNQTENKETLSYDLRFLSDLRERIKVDGNGPRAIQAIGNQLFVANYFTDNLNVFDFNDKANSKTVQLTKNTEMDETRLGEMYFNDASYCFQSWQSCNGCHPDEARTDGLNWDLLNDGMGNPKNCKSMLLAHVTAPAMITGIRPSAEVAVRKGFTHIQFTQIEETHAVAVDNYLKSLIPVPSPYLVDGELSNKAKKGKQVFENTGCNHCHFGSYFTDQKRHEMGKQGAYDHQNTWDTPTLIEVWRTGPYLHDGRSATMKDVFIEEQHGLRKELSNDEMEQLVEYVMSL